MYTKIGYLTRSSMIGTSVFTVMAATKDSSPPISLKERACDLPLYDTSRKECECKHSKEETTGVRKTVEDGISIARTNVCQGYNAIAKEAKQVEHFYETGKEHSKFIVDYLNEPSNSAPRAGAIAVGALSGYIIGLRHGFIRRLFYTSIGGAAIASLCYPKEAEIYAQKGLTEAKQYSTILVNFIYGIKPGDDAKSLELPSSVSKSLDTIASAFETVKNVFSGKK